MMPGRARYPSHVQAALDAAAEAQDARPRGDLRDVWLPFPPSVNSLYRSIVARGRVMVVKTDDGRRYEAAVARTVTAHLAQLGIRAPLPPYRLTIRAYPPDRRKHDLDNLLKAAQDALFDALGLEDNDVVELHVTKHDPSGPDGHIVVALEGVGS